MRPILVNGPNSLCRQLFSVHCVKTFQVRITALYSCVNTCVRLKAKDNQAHILQNHLSFNFFKPHLVHLKRKERFPCVSRMISYNYLGEKTLPEMLFLYPGSGEIMP